MESRAWKTGVAGSPTTRAELTWFNPGANLGELLSEGLGRGNVIILGPRLERAHREDHPGRRPSDVLHRAHADLDLGAGQDVVASVEVERKVVDAADHHGGPDETRRNTLRLEPAEVDGDVGGGDRAGGMAAEHDGFGIAAVARHVAADPADRQARILHRVQHAVAVAAQAVARQHHDDPPPRQLGGQEAVVGPVALDEAAPVDVQQNRGVLQGALRKVDVQLLAGIAAIGKVQHMADLSPRLGAQRDDLLVETLEVEVEALGVEHRHISPIVAGGHDAASCILSGPRAPACGRGSGAGSMAGAGGQAKSLKAGCQ